MAAQKTIVLLVTALSLLPLTGCKLGKVVQGRVIAYDKEGGRITLVPEQWDRRSASATYILPAITITTPADPAEMGPPPRPGKLLSIDLKRRQLLYFDSSRSALKTIAWDLLNEQAGVFDDDPRVTKAVLPLTNHEKKSVTLYSPRDRKLIEIRVADEYLALPEDTWIAGDEIRYYCKDSQQALRLMNVSLTDVNKGGH